jgi:hypothetical protein
MAEIEKHENNTNPMVEVSIGWWMRNHMHGSTIVIVVATREST